MEIQIRKATTKGSIAPCSLGVGYLQSGGESFPAKGSWSCFMTATIESGKECTGTEMTDVIALGKVVTSSEVATMALGEGRGRRSRSAD
jgi:hypothetical protein